MISGARMLKIDLFLDQKYLPLDNRTKVLIGIAAFFLPALLFYFLCFKPQVDEISILQKQGEAVGEELKKARLVARDLPRYKKEFEDVQK